MRIAIDAHSVGAKLGGNESYALNLIEALAQIDRVNEYTLYVTTADAFERFHRRWPNFSVHNTLPHTPLIRIPLTLSSELRKNPVDVLHVQFTAPPFCPCPRSVLHLHFSASCCARLLNTQTFAATAVAASILLRFATNATNAKMRFA